MTPEFLSQKLIARLIIAGIFFWIGSQESIEILKVTSDPRTGSLFISHIVVPNCVAVRAQDNALLDLIFDSVETKASICCIANVKHFIL